MALRLCLFTVACSWGDHHVHDTVYGVAGASRGVPQAAHGITEMTHDFLAGFIITCRSSWSARGGSNGPQGGSLRCCQLLAFRSAKLAASEADLCIYTQTWQHRVFLVFLFYYKCTNSICTDLSFPQSLGLCRLCECRELPIITTSLGQTAHLYLISFMIGVPSDRRAFG